MAMTGTAERQQTDTARLLEARKRAAAEFVQLAAFGRTDEAFRDYLAPGFIHHNPHFQGNADALKAGMTDNARQFPNKRLDVLRVIGEGDLVAVHSRVHLTPEDRGYAIAHIYRFEGDRVAELWDIAMEAPADVKNERGMF